MNNMINALVNIPTKPPTTTPKGNKTQERERFKDLILEKSNEKLTVSIKEPEVEGEDVLPEEVSSEQIAMLMNGQFLVTSDLIAQNLIENTVTVEVPKVNPVVEVDLQPVIIENILTADGIDVSAMRINDMASITKEVPVFVETMNIDQSNESKPVNVDKNVFAEVKSEVKNVPFEATKVNVESPAEVVVKQMEESVQKPVITGEAVTVNMEQEKKNLQELGINPANVKAAEAEMPDVQKVSFKVGDTVNANSDDFAKDIADKIIYKATGKSNEFEINLNPKELGKINIKLVFEGGKAEISIMCANQKAYNLLSENAGNISSIIKENTGNQTNIVVQENKEFFNEQENDDGRSQNGRQNQEQENSKRNSENSALDFVQQLRLGMFEMV